MTPANLQESAGEVDIPSDRVREAARSPGPPEPRFRHPLISISVHRSVDLPRAMEESEWKLLVAFARETFDAAGRVARQDGLREWANGNLRIAVEPSSTGYRLRMGTRKGSAVAAFASGTLAVAAGFLALLLTLAMDDSGSALVAPLLLVAIGFGVILFAAIRLPDWAARRASQMENVESYVLRLLGGGAWPGAD